MMRKGPGSVEPVGLVELACKYYSAVWVVVVMFSK